MIKQTITILRQEGFRRLEARGGLAGLVEQLSAEAAVLEKKLLAGEVPVGLLQEQQAVLNSLLAAMQARDGVLLADILEYQWLPLAARLSRYKGRRQ